MERHERLVQLHVGGLHADLAATRHGVAGIDRQVHEHLLDQAGIAPDQPESGLHLHAQRDVLAEDPSQQLLGASQQAAQLERLLP